MSKLRDDAVAQINTLWNYYKAERALADDLAAKLDNLLYGDDPDVPGAEQALARYREARQP